MRLPFLLALSLYLLGTWAPAEPVRVGVAVSLKEALSELAQTYQAENTGDTIELVFGSSGQIASQIRSGAALDLFISAGQKQVEELDTAKLIKEGSKRIIARNQLVLVVPEASQLKTFSDLASIKRLAIGEPSTVPAGEYAMGVIRWFKLEDALKGKLVYGTNVRQVLSYVARSEVDAGLVYATDVREEPKVKQVAVAPAESHAEIVYPAVVVAASKHPAAADRFLNYITSPKGQTTLAQKGFLVQPTTPPNPLGTTRP